MSPPAAGSPDPSGVLGSILGHAVTSPGRPAADDTTRLVDYAGLRSDVAAVAAGLSSRRIGPGDRVAIHLPNSIDFVVTALAALWVGAIFVPLSVSDPLERIGGILEDCDPAVVVTSPESEGGTALVHDRSVGLSELRVAGHGARLAEDDADRPVYAVYTSGTTGTPKGVLVTGGAFARAVGAVIDALELDGATRTLCVSAFHFDGSFATLFPTLVAGGLVVIPPRDSLLFARTFLNAVLRHGITYTGFSPSYLRLLLDSARTDRLASSPLRVVALGGEAASREDVEQLRAAVPHLRIFNRYGPTETVIAVTHHEIGPAPAGTPVPIGRPHPGVDFYLLDGDGRLVEEVDRVGELWIGGAQLMAGYWRAPALTAAVLRKDVVPGETVYRTGDLMVRTAAGDYLYVDRADRVVKRSGVRISLVEIAEVLRTLPGVARAASTLYDDGEDGPIGIAAFVVAETDVTADQLRRAAGLRLPPTMLPDRIELVDTLPLTPAGKLDERRLLAGAGLRPHRSPTVTGSAR